MTCLAPVDPPTPFYLFCLCIVVLKVHVIESKADSGAINAERVTKGSAACVQKLHL